MDGFRTGLDGRKGYVWLESRRPPTKFQHKPILRLLYAHESFCKGNWEVLARTMQRVYSINSTDDVAGEFTPALTMEVLPTDAR